MARCAVCGRPPQEVCCPRCHEVHDRLWREVYEPELDHWKSKAKNPERPLCGCHGEPMNSNGPNYWRQKKTGSSASRAIASNVLELTIAQIVGTTSR